MARSLVIFEGKKYANIELYQAMFRVGNDGFQKAIATGKTKMRKLFDDKVYEIYPEHEHRLEDLDVTQYNVDIDLRNIEVLLDRGKCRAFSVPETKLTGVIRWSGFQFIRFADILDKQKYVCKHRMPIIRICGSMYVAINAKNRAARNPVIVTVTSKAA